MILGYMTTKLYNFFIYFSLVFISCDENNPVIDDKEKVGFEFIF